ncbi:hypothetical protein [Pseudomonas amygdali]|uniref:hypothetical protein n=1 Tax=Pseudomonas amygdali TaxID=47877 RepID=UPI0001BC8E76|nr:hypothetical protein [Pseudomonas amygdali]
MNRETRVVKVAMPLDLIEMLEAEAKEYESFAKMMNAVARRYFLHKNLREEFAKLEK